MHHSRITNVSLFIFRWKSAHNRTLAHLRPLFPSMHQHRLFIGSLRWASYKMCRREVGSWALRWRERGRHGNWRDGCSGVSSDAVAIAMELAPLHRALPARQSNKVLMKWWGRGAGGNTAMTDTQAKTLLLKSPHCWLQHAPRSCKTFAFYQAKGQQLTTVRSLGARIAKNS